jgi:hypothetical protein
VASMTAVAVEVGSAGRESVTSPVTETMNVGPSTATNSHVPWRLRSNVR